jgi:hypothetical protein
MIDIAMPGGTVEAESATIVSGPLAPASSVSIGGAPRLIDPNKKKNLHHEGHKEHEGAGPSWSSQGQCGNWPSVGLKIDHATRLEVLFRTVFVPFVVIFSSLQG